MANLERITTDYIEAEDRVRLSGELGPNQALVIWLTQRLLQRLVPVLLQWLERGGAGDALRAEVMQGFAQQAARAELTPQKPVRVAPESTAWLALSVNLKQYEKAVSLSFKGAREGQEATLLLADKLLRQWLSILYRAYRKAGWPQDQWPEWLQESSAPPSPPGQGSLLH